MTMIYVPGGRTMQTIQIRERTDKTGTLSLTIPLGRPDTEFDIAVVAQPREANGAAPLDWRAAADAIREELRTTGRTFSDSTELIREDRDR
jgi:hypothetical protein